MRVPDYFLMHSLQNMEQKKQNLQLEIWSQNLKTHKIPTEPIV